MWVIVIVIAFIAITLLNRFLSAEHENRDCLRLYTGGLGSGKTYRAVDCACAAYRKAVLKFKIYKFFHPKKGRKIEKPRLYGCGIRISDRKGNIISEDMTVDHFLQKERMPEHSIVVFDEVGDVLSQWDYDLQLVLPELDRFIRWFRHFVDGRMFMTDQVSSNVSKFIRTRCNRAYNVSNFRRMWGVLPFYKVDVEVLLMSEDNTQNVNRTQTNKEGLIFVHNRDVSLPYFIGYLPYSKKHNRYDSRAYSEFYLCKNKPLRRQFFGSTRKVEHIVDFTDEVVRRRWLMKKAGVKLYKDLKRSDKNGQEGDNSVSVDQ